MDGLRDGILMEAHSSKSWQPESIPFPLNWFDWSPVEVIAKSGSYGTDEVWSCGAGETTFRRGVTHNQRSEGIVIKLQSGVENRGPRFGHISGNPQFDDVSWQVIRR